MQHLVLIFKKLLKFEQSRVAPSFAFNVFRPDIALLAFSLEIITFKLLSYCIIQQILLDQFNYEVDICIILL